MPIILIEEDTNGLYCMHAMADDLNRQKDGHGRATNQYGRVRAKLEVSREYFPYMREQAEKIADRLSNGEKFNAGDELERILNEIERMDRGEVVYARQYV